MRTTGEYIQVFMFDSPKLNDIILYENFIGVSLDAPRIACYTCLESMADHVEADSQTLSQELGADRLHARLNRAF